jgi:putative SOS response-associated peptidase YedK
MCGRYVLFGSEELQEIRDIINEVQRKVNGEIKTGEVFPTDRAPVLIQKEGLLSPEAVIWGFPGFHGKGVIINARAETVPEKTMFRDCLAARRCVIPSTGFYEWSHDGQKTKYLFNLPGAGALYMAGLYQEYWGENRFVILTTAANASMAEIHSRMPVVLDRDGMKRWMSSEQTAAELLTKVPPELVKTSA